MSNTAPFLFCPMFRAFDSAGVPLAGGLLYTYAAGTTTPLATYSDAAGSIQNANPVVLDSTGSATVRLGTSAYKFVLKDSGGSTQWTEDNYIPYADGGTFVGTITLGSLTVSTGANATTVGPTTRGTAQPMFHAYRSTGAGDQTLTNNATTTVVFDTELKDQTSAYDNTTGIFTAATAGNYLFTVQLYTTSNGSATQLYGPYYLSKNNVATAGNCWALSGHFMGEVAATGVPASSHGLFFASVVISLAATDTVRIKCQQPNNAGGAFTLTALLPYNYFAGYLLG